MNQKQITFSERLSLYQSQVQTYTGFSGTMAAVVLFFTGIILTKYGEFNVSIKVPIAFLIISMFGFLYSALLYADAAQEVADHNEKRFRRAVLLGDIISEYMGVYLLVLTIPLVVNVVTTDFFLRIVTLASSLIGLAIYQFSHFSIIERHFRHRHPVFSSIALFFGLALPLAQIKDSLFVPMGLLLLVFLAGITYGASRNPKL